MATIDYEKKYKEALKKAKNTIEVNQTIPDIVECVESLFPELRESEDERIRKWLIYYFKEVCDNVSEKEKKGVLAYLEKQGEQDSSWSEEDERNIKELLYLVEANYLNSEEPHDRLINFLKSLLKDRVQLQPKLKKEWSKEEEKMLDEMYEFF